MRALSSRSAGILVASSTLTVCALRLLQWRARKRAREAAERARRYLPEGALIDVEDESVKLRILNRAIRRAFKWLSYHASDNTSAQRMLAQVGGISEKRRPVLTMAPDYAMKPLHSDHRGYRELAFYEAMKLASQTGAGYHQVAAAIAGQDEAAAVERRELLPQRTLKNLVLASVDLLAMWLAIFLKDSEVAASEQTLVASWKATKREIDLLRRLSNFTPQYYGVVKGSNGVRTNGDAPPEHISEIGEDSYLLLSDVTASYCRPCVIDIKIGRQTYEPDAPEEKRIREHAKYPQQATFGFRIVGMRHYEPNHPDADENGYRYFGKSYGQSLTTLEDVVEAFRTFFSAGIAVETETIAEDEGADATGQQKPVLVDQPRIRSRAVSNLVLLARHLNRWFDENESYCFYASSLLLVYEGNWQTNDSVTLKMIDLGHTRRGAKGDDGYAFGLRSLISVLTSLVEDTS